MRLSRGLTNAIAILMLIIVVLVISIPMITFFTNTQQTGTEKLALVNNYIFLKNLQVKQVEYGHPAIYYANSSIEFYYTNGTFVPPTNLTIVKILYLQGGVWLNLSYHYPITINAFTNLTLPSYVQGKPIIIVTSLGNVFFLTPKSSIGPYSTSAKGGLVIAAEIAEPNGPIGVATNVTTNINGPYKNYTTPIAFPNQTGTFVVKAPEYVFYERPNGSIVTGVFHNWILGGQVTANSTTSSSISVSLTGGTATLTANYTPITDYVNLEVQSFNGENVNILIDGNRYTVTGTQNINVLAGYVNITILTNQFYINSTNIHKHYMLVKSVYNGKSYTADSYIIFVNPFSSSSNILDLVFENDYSLYKVNIYYGVYTNKYGVAAPPNVTKITPYAIGYVGTVYLGNPGSNSGLFELNSTEYTYNNPYWIRNGTYVIGYVGTVYTNGIYVIDNFPIVINCFYVSFNDSPPQSYSALDWLQYVTYVNGTPYTQPNITIDSPLTIEVYYAWTTGYTSL
ncbi:hypothetical protein DFR88_10055 [Metallosphaera sedula]|uniref:Uncharacterized protein n=1 Tax=Metallosphaera prunae TaxID=47304 RepID=A0A4D8RYF4_METPR|nr:hypothetical protein [Metallosphaera prunae]QCO30784.1 hypothetical protein DFR88_10055 [Metallosphaera prunae]